MTATAYSVKVDVYSTGTTYNLSIATGNDVPHDVAAAYGLADPLTITQALQTGDRLIQEHPLPEECSFALIAPDATTYQQLAIGDPVAVKLYNAAAFAGSPAVTFYGRVATLSAEPHRLGVIYQVGCIDYLADLAEIQVGLTNYPLERDDFRMNRVLAEAGITAQLGTDTWIAAGSGGFGGAYLMPARSKSPTDLLSMLLDILDTTQTTTFNNEVGVFTGFTPAGQYIPQQQRSWIQPRITNDRLDPVTPFVVGRGVPYTKRRGYVPPARLTNVAGVYKITVAAADSSPSTGAPIIDAGSVDIGTTFTQSKDASLPSRIITQDASGQSAQFDWYSLYVFNNRTGVLSQLGSPLSGQQVLTQDIRCTVDPSGADGGDFTYNWEVPFQPDLRSTWTSPSLTWHVWNVSGWRRPILTELLTIARANVTKTPPNREWLAGQVAGTRVVVEKGRPRIELQLQPSQLDYAYQSFYAGAAAGVLRWDSATALPGTVTFAQLSTRDTFTDYQLVRGS